MDSLENEFFKKYITEELSVEEKDQFNERLVNDARFRFEFEHFKSHLLKDNYSTDFNFNQNAAFDKIKRHIEREKLQRYNYNVDKKYLRTRTLKIAASLSIIMIFSVILYLNPILNEGNEALMVSQTKNGQKPTTITLSDGSTVHLNAGSTLKYPSIFNKENRTVELEGEAFFEVAKDKNKPFIVKTASISTRVLGTSFNVLAHSGSSIHEIAVKTGSVGVSILGKNHKEILVEPGSTIKYDNESNKLERKNIDPKVIGMWSEGYLMFSAVPLSEVVKSLERLYDISIELENKALANCKITFKQKNESLINILEILKYSININYKIEEDKIIIDGEAC